MPKRIQRRRIKGWRKPAGAVIVTRPSRFGNPFTRDQAIEAGFLTEASSPEEARRFLAQCFRDWLTGRGPCEWWQGPESDRRKARILDNIGTLRGKDLVCWCPEDGPCHAEVLLELANG